MMTKMMIAAAVLVMTTACCGQKAVLEGTQWKLAKMEGIPATAIAQDAENFTLMLVPEKMSVNGKTNCNRFFGQYKVSGEEVEFENLGMTRMACPDMQYENLFVKMLDETDRYTIKGSTLKLYDDKKEIAAFEVMPK